METAHAIHYQAARLPACLSADSLSIPDSSQGRGPCWHFIPLTSLVFLSLTNSNSDLTASSSRTQQLKINVINAWKVEKARFFFLMSCQTYSFLNLTLVLKDTRPGVSLFPSRLQMLSSFQLPASFVGLYIFLYLITHCNTWNIKQFFSMKKWVLFPNDNMLSILNSRNKEMSWLEQRGKGQGKWEKLGATRIY